MGPRRDRVQPARGRRLVLGVARDLREAAGAHHDQARGVPRAAGAHGPRVRGGDRGSRRSRAHRRDVARGRAARARALGRRAPRAARRRRRRADRDLTAQRIHRPRGRGFGHRARERAARGRGHARRGIRNHPHPSDGVGDGPERLGDPVRRVPRRLDGGLDRRLHPARTLVEPRGRRGAPRLRAEGHHRARLRARGCRPPSRRAAWRWCSRSTRWPGACRGT